MSEPRTEAGRALVESWQELARAIEDEAARKERERPLDVERLAEAMENAFVYDEEVAPETMRSIAAEIARQYAAITDTGEEAAS